jgi:hypothetical protein
MNECWRRIIVIARLWSSSSRHQGISAQCTFFPHRKALTPSLSAAGQFASIIPELLNEGYCLSHQTEKQKDLHQNPGKCQPGLHLGAADGPETDF